MSGCARDPNLSGMPRRLQARNYAFRDERGQILISPRVRVVHRVERLALEYVEAGEDMTLAQWLFNRFAGLSDGAVGWDELSPRARRWWEQEAIDIRNELAR